MITGGLASPNQMESNPKSAKLGTVRMVLATAMITVDRGSERAAAIPSTSPITLVIATHSATISRWVTIWGPIWSQFSEMY